MAIVLMPDAWAMAKLGKENWTNLPGTFAQIKRFFIGTKDQEVPADKVKNAA